MGRSRKGSRMFCSDRWHFALPHHSCSVCRPAQPRSREHSGKAAGNVSGSQSQSFLQIVSETRCTGLPAAPFPSCTATVLWGYAADLLPRMSSGRDEKQQTFSDTEAFYVLVGYHSYSKHLNRTFRSTRPLLALGQRRHRRCRNNKSPSRHRQTGV